MSDTSYTETVTLSGAQTALKTILLAGSVAGTMDITGAIVVYAGLYGVTTVVKILQSISSGLLGSDAYSGGTTTAALGLFLHYVIAFSWAILYFLIYSYIPFLRKQKVISGFLYGIFVWAVMNLVVLPLSQIGWRPLSWSGAIVGAAILMVCIGLPISLLVSRYYAAKMR